MQQNNTPQYVNGPPPQFVQAQYAPQAQYQASYPVPQQTIVTVNSRNDSEDDIIPALVMWVPDYVGPNAIS
jgi:hypothetical protein